MGVILESGMISVARKSHPVLREYSKLLENCLEGPLGIPRHTNAHKLIDLVSVYFLW
jgi:hypothetical protein